MISQRTRGRIEGCQRARRGSGWLSRQKGYCTTDCERARAVQAANADRMANDSACAIAALRSEGHHSLRSMAAELNARVITAASGGAWTPAQIS